ncbi:uncharacterized protein N0V89_009113 [Didymosphaeria variabile]|uniref:F-box domain-containing protein n=1 Tax=Didymosphaeria variabile TaxID=1932322 RepID=A0A9W8XIW7_9PLEO|nr:uncharacterized protein N0V89_009113 [Didymosphaeria variabile]KAJ4350492.1 hypothetical protein N0V89_009113 [Didymosphaeria variabile]
MGDKESFTATSNIITSLGTMRMDEGVLVNDYPYTADSDTSMDDQEEAATLSVGNDQFDKDDADTFMDAYHDAFMSGGFHDIEEDSNILWGDDADDILSRDNNAQLKQVGHNLLGDDHDVEMEDHSGDPVNTNDIERTDAESACVRSVHFRFLDLPAELRNRVYDFCAAEDYAKPGDTYHFDLEENPIQRVQRRTFRLHVIKSHSMPLTHVNKQIRNEFSPVFQNLMISRPLNESQALIHVPPASAPSCGSSSRSSRTDHLIVYLRLYSFLVYRKTFDLSPQTPPPHSLIVLLLNFGRLGELIDAQELLTLCDKNPGLIMASDPSPKLRVYFKFPFNRTHHVMGASPLFNRMFWQSSAIPKNKTVIEADEASPLFNRMFRQSSAILKNKTAMTGLKSITFQGCGQQWMMLWIEYDNIPNDPAVFDEKYELWRKVLLGPGDIM